MARGAPVVWRAAELPPVWVALAAWTVMAAEGQVPARLAPEAAGKCFRPGEGTVRLASRVRGPEAAAVQEMEAPVWAVLAAVVGEAAAQAGAAPVVQERPAGSGGAPVNPGSAASDRFFDRFQTPSSLGRGEEAVPAAAPAG